MGAKSSIEWTDASWSPIRARDPITNKIGWHCEHVTTGCINCYAEGINKRLGTGLQFKPGNRNAIDIFLDEEMLLAPLRWKRPRRVFVCSMTDTFAEFVKDEWLDKMFAVMALCPQHTFQCLTKRAERMRDYVSRRNGDSNRYTAQHRIWMMLPKVDEWATGAKVPPWPLPNVWLGVSAERQQEWDERKEHLKNTPAAVHFASFEPLIGPIVEPQPMSDFIQWVIVGGESGPNARPMNPQWARDLRDACAVAGVAFFHKQNGEFVSVSEVEGLGAHYTFPDGRTVRRTGKKLAGRLLDGREWNQMPEVHHA